MTTQHEINNAVNVRTVAALHEYRQREYGPPSNPRKVQFYGHFPRRQTALRFRVNQAHVEALVENAGRTA